MPQDVSSIHRAALRMLPPPLGGARDVSRNGGSTAHGIIVTFDCVPSAVGTHPVVDHFNIPIAKAGQTSERALSAPLHHSH